MRKLAQRKYKDMEEGGIVVNSTLREQEGCTFDPEFQSSQRFEYRLWVVCKGYVVKTQLDSNAGSASSWQCGLRKLFKGFGPQFNHQSNGNDNGTILVGLFRGLKEKHGRHLVQVSPPSVPCDGLRACLANTGHRS